MAKQAELKERTAFPHMTSAPPSAVGAVASASAVPAGRPRTVSSPIPMQSATTSAAGRPLSPGKLSGIINIKFTGIFFIYIA